MSSRQLRKLRKPLDEENLDEGAPESDLGPPTISKPSLFAKLAILQDENGADDESDKESDNHDQIVLRKDSSSVVTAKKSKKSKKKKLKLKSKAQNPGVPNQPKEHLDEIDAALRELNLKGGEHAIASQTPRQLDPEYERVCALLCINSQRLKVANEMRNLFGPTSVENHEDAGNQIPRGARRRQRDAQQRLDLETALRGRHAPGKGLPELTLRRNLFIQGKDEWPRGTTGGLAMEVVSDRQSVDGTVEFRFSHSYAYAVVQDVFLTLVEMGDPQNLIGYLLENPYNISLLLQVSKIAKDQGDHALSSDLIERALFSFARAASSLFATKLSQGKARLNFARPENREFWLAGWQYIKSLQMKGTYRTALEWAKILLSMSPEQDPYCMLFMIHHLALRAFEAQYLLEINDVVMPKVANKLAPNFIAPSLVLAALQLRDGQKARSLLQQSIQHQPWLFRRLFQELNLDNAPRSIWGVEPRTDAENLLSDLYVYQTKDLWNTPETTSLLMEVAHATERLQGDVIPKIQNSEITLDIARFIYLDNTPALMALVPSKLLHRTPNSDFDPLPPDHNVFSWESQRKPWIASERQSNPGSYLTDLFNPLAAIRDMFPAWGRAPTEDEDEPGLVELRERRLAELREAMEQNMEMEEPAAAEQDSGAASTGSLRRVYEILFGARDQASETQDTEDSEPSNHDGSDTGDEMDDYEDTPSR